MVKHFAQWDEDELREQMMQVPPAWGGEAPKATRRTQAQDNRRREMILEFIRANGPCNIHDVVNFVGDCNRHAMSQMLRRMRVRGLVRHPEGHQHKWIAT